MTQVVAALHHPRSLPPVTNQRRRWQTHSNMKALVTESRFTRVPSPVSVWARSFPRCVALRCVIPFPRICAALHPRRVNRAITAATDHRGSFDDPAVQLSATRPPSMSQHLQAPLDQQPRSAALATNPVALSHCRGFAADPCRPVQSRRRPTTADGGRFELQLAPPVHGPVPLLCSAPESRLLGRR